MPRLGERMPWELSWKQELGLESVAQPIQTPLSAIKLNGTINKKIAELECLIQKLTNELVPMEKDERHPNSRHFPSQASRDGAVTDLRKQLENAQDDLALLREVNDGRLDLKDAKFFRREIINLGEARDNLWRHPRHK